MSCSGFEDTVFQSSVCTSGSINGILSGSHYNQAWFVHNIMSEAMERLLLTRFMAEVSIVSIVSKSNLAIVCFPVLSPFTSTKSFRSTDNLFIENVFAMFKSTMVK